jgi:hypothetical protein
VITVRDFSPTRQSCKKEEMLLQRKYITSKTIEKFMRLESFLQVDSWAFDCGLCHYPCPYLSRNFTWVGRVGGGGDWDLDLADRLTVVAVALRLH